MTQRLMVALVAACMTVGSVFAAQNFGQSYTWSTGSTVEYVFNAACTATMTVTNTGDGATSMGIYYGPSYAYSTKFYLLPGVSQDFSLQIDAAGTQSFWLSNGNDKLTYVMTAPGHGTTPGGGGGDPIVKDPEPGDDPAHAIDWTTGGNSYNAARNHDLWYKISVPANSLLSIKANYAQSNFKGYAGIEDAEAKTNPVEFTYNFDIYGPACEYSNTGTTAIDFYVLQEKYAYDNDGTANITIESLASLNDAKSIGKLAFDVANNANVGTALGSVQLTFPEFVGGAKDDYTITVTYTLYQLTSDGFVDFGVDGYYNKTADGTAKAGVVLALPTLTADTKYQVMVSQVNVTDGNLSQDFTAGNTVNFTAVNVPDGTEGNPYIITEAGVAGPDHTATYGNWTWYKYVCPSDGLVTISHTWMSDNSANSANIITTGLIRMNGVQVFARVPESWSYGCHAGDVILVAIATERAVDDQLIQASISEPKEGDTRDKAKVLNTGSNTIALVKSGAMSGWYKFSLAAKHEATLTFGAAIAARYYIGEATTGSNITNNGAGNAELKYSNESEEAIDIYVEVTGTNDLLALSANLAIEEIQNIPSDVQNVRLENISKRLMNGMLLIERDGRLYNAQGVLMH